MQSEELIVKTAKHLRGLLSEAFHHSNSENAVVVYDTRCLIATLLMEGYKRALPHARLINFDEHEPQEVRALLEALNPSDLVVLIQSTNFRLDAFRLRVELFKLKLKVIEHPHLSRMSDDEASYFIDSLEYDKEYYRPLGRALQSKIDNAPMGVLDSGGELLTYGSPFEPS